MKIITLSGMHPTIVSGMYKSNVILCIILNCMLRCMGHIVNLAQQAFICALTGGKDWLEASIGNDEEPDLSGLEELPVEGVLIGPLLACM